MDTILADAERNSRQGDQSGNDGPSGRTTEQQQQEGIPDIELLLDCERPGMEQWLQLCVPGEIACMSPEKHIGKHHLVGHGGLCQLAVVIRKEHGKSGDQRGENDHEAGGKNSADSANPELRQIELPGLQLTPHQACDQKSGNDKEYVDPNKPAPQPQIRVEEQNQGNRDRSKAIDVGSIFGNTRHDDFAINGWNRT